MHFSAHKSLESCYDEWIRDGVGMPCELSLSGFCHFRYEKQEVGYLRRILQGFRPEEAFRPFAKPRDAKKENFIQYTPDDHTILCNLRSDMTDDDDEQ